MGNCKSPRVRQSIDLDWRFLFGDDAKASEREFDDASWRRLNVPHDYSIEGEYKEDSPMGRRGGFLPVGVGWYRRVIDIPQEWLGKKVFVEFDGVYRNAEVWLNGERLGGRPFGYISFEFELTDHMVEGKNVLAIRVDTTDAPSDRWYAGSGIYRHVWLRVADPIHIPQYGVFASTAEASEEAATIRVETTVRNDSSEARTIDVAQSLDDVACPQESIEVEAGSEATVVQTLEVTSPRLWSDESPDLYALTSSLIVDGETVDKLVTDFGIRTTAFDGQKGFLLNGRQVKMRGVCNHHDAGPLGAAVPDKITEARVRQLKAMGCNAIRTSHNPFAPEFYDICDRLGMLVMDEIFDGWHRKASFDYGGVHFDKWWRRDLDDFIRRDRNHPCVVVWSIGNETGRDDIHGMTEIIHGLDPTRAVTGGMMTEGVDVRGFNGPAETPGVIDADREEHPDSPYVLTETPHSYATRGYYRVKTWYRDFQRVVHEIPDLADEEIFTDDWAARHPRVVCYNSSYDNATVRISCRQNWEMTRDHDWIAGEFRWTGYDYLGESFGWPFRLGNNGVIDVCGFEKDPYYLYQSQWSRAPMVHLLPHWTHPGMDGVVIPVWAYSNCDEVELFLNDRSLGVRKPGATSDDMQCEWRVPYEPGVLRAIGRRDGKDMATARQATASQPAGMTTKPEGLPLIEEGAPDIADVTITVVDADGEFCPKANNRVFFGVEGPAILKAVDNGDPVDLEAHGTGSRRAFAGLCKAFVETTGEAGAVRLISAAVMGARRFKESATIRIAIETADLRGAFDEDAVEIRFTTDGSEPNDDSPLFDAPLTLTGDTTIRARVYVGETMLLLEETFTQGDETACEDDGESMFPLSDRVVGQWQTSEEGHADRILNFKGDGFIEIIKNGKVVDYQSWWYEEPIDPFEAPDLDKGKVLFNWTEWGLNLLDDDHLRVTLAAKNGGGQIVYERLSES